MQISPIQQEEGWPVPTRPVLRKFCASRHEQSDHQQHQGPGAFRSHLVIMQSARPLTSLAAQRGVVTAFCSAGRRVRSRGMAAVQATATEVAEAAAVETK